MRSVATLTLLSLGTLGCVAERGPLTNEMAEAGTRYLALAAREPVGWQTWSEETFRLAARLDRPVLLYIGAEDCRLCAAMDRETYAQLAMGALIDSLFVPVRVDRDERPDVAARYAVAVELLAGLRGYPLTAFLTPDGAPFFGGTYFLADDPVTGRGMKQILPEVARSFRKERPFIRRQAALLEQLASARQTGAHGVLEPQAIAAAIDSVRAELAAAPDARAPVASVRFTQAVGLLLEAAAEGGDARDLALARPALDLLADSGAAALAATRRDDPPALVRAGMLRALATGWTLTGDTRYRDATRPLMRALRTAVGGGSRRAAFTDREAYLVGSLLAGGRAIEDSGTIESARVALDGLLARVYARGHGVRHGSTVPSAAPALFQDQVQVADAALEAYQATGNSNYLGVARDLAATFERDFADSLGGYFDSAPADSVAPALADRTKQVLDDLLPGANAWAARVLLELARVTGEAAYRRRAEATLEAFAGLMPAQGARASSYLATARAVLSTP